MPENNPLGYLSQNPGTTSGVSLFDTIAADLPEFQGFMKLQETFANLNKQLQDRQAQMQQEVQNRQQQLADALNIPQGQTAQLPTGGGRTQEPQNLQNTVGGARGPVDPNMQQVQLPDLSSVLGGSRPVMGGNNLGQLIGEPVSGFQPAMGPGSPGGNPFAIGPGFEPKGGLPTQGGVPTSGVAQPVPQPQNTSESGSRADRVRNTGSAVDNSSPFGFATGLVRRLGNG